MSKFVNYTRRTSRALQLLGSLALFALGSTHVQAQRLSDQDLRHSQWNTKYEALNNESVNAVLTFNDGEGHYNIPGARGMLSNVTYKLTLGGGATIQGTWSLGGTDGQFTFFVAGNSNPPIFSGSWQSGGRSGNWSGIFNRVVTAMAQGVQYGPWYKDPNHDRYYCEVRYPAKNNPNTYNAQTVIWYPNDPSRTSYYYFVTKSNQIWGRCVCPASPAYSPQTMQWSKLMGDQWQDLARGECPAPSDGDPQLASINDIPDPPV